MTESIGDVQAHTAPSRWLTQYYFTRAAFSVVWVCLALALAESHLATVAALVLIYPAWDAIANVVDAQCDGGISRNPTQACNAGVSALTTLSVAVAFAHSMNAVLNTFGVWAALSGLLQLDTGVRRWTRFKGQWPMIISGYQSTAAGATFLLKAHMDLPVTIIDIAPYSAFGGFYFLVAAMRQRSA